MGYWYDWRNHRILVEIMTESSMVEETEHLESLREKRTTTLVAVWNTLLKGNLSNLIRKDLFQLSIPLVNEIVQHYLRDYTILKYRYKIPDKIQLYKIAGLMTSSILRFRPILPLVEEYETDEEMYINEIFAVVHGISICGEYHENEINKILQEQWFQEWMNEFVYLLHYRNYTPESLMFIYRTISYFQFPNNICED